MQLKKNLRQIENDLNKIRKALSPYLSKIGLFGSVLEKKIEEVSDIDLVIIYDNIEYEELRKILKKLRISRPIHIQKLNGTYGRAAKSEKQKTNDYHIIAMPANHINEKFMQINRGKIYYISTT